MKSTINGIKMTSDHFPSRLSKWYIQWHQEMILVLNILNTKYKSWKTRVALNCYEALSMQVNAKIIIWWGNALLLLSVTLCLCSESLSTCVKIWRKTFSKESLGMLFHRKSKYIVRAWPEKELMSKRWNERDSISLLAISSTWPMIVQ